MSVLDILLDGAGSAFGLVTFAWIIRKAMWLLFCRDVDRRHKESPADAVAIITATADRRSEVVPHREMVRRGRPIR